MIWKNISKKHFNKLPTGDCPTELIEAPKFINDLHNVSWLEIKNHMQKKMIPSKWGH